MSSKAKIFFAHLKGKQPLSYGIWETHIDKK